LIFRYYAIRTLSGDNIFGGTLIDGDSGSHEICLQGNQCYYSMLDYFGNAPTEISYVICGQTLHYYDIAKICVDSSANVCTVELLTSPPPSFICSGTAISFTMIDVAAVGWPSAAYAISQMTGDTNSHSVVATGGYSSFGFVKADSICLSDGCYDFEVVGPKSATQLWSVSDVRGPIPWAATLCVESSYR